MTNGLQITRNWEAMQHGKIWMSHCVEWCHYRRTVIKCQVHGKSAGKDRVEIM